MAKKIPSFEILTLQFAVLLVCLSMHRAAYSCHKSLKCMACNPNGKCDACYNMGIILAKGNTWNYPSFLSGPNC